MSNMESQFHYEEGCSLRNIKFYNKALDAFDEAIKLNPNYQEAWYSKGLTLQDLERSREAITAFEKAIEINDKSDFASYAWYDKGLIHRKLAGVENERKVRLEEALDAFRNAIIINPKYGCALYNEGLTLRDLGNNEEALKFFDKAIEIDRKYDDSYYYKGIVLRELGDKVKEYEVKIQKYDEAIKAFDNVTYSELFHSSVFYVLYNKGFTCYKKGLALRDTGKHDKAIQNFDEATIYFDEAIKNHDKILKKNNKHTENSSYFDVLNFKGYTLIQYNKYPKYMEAISLYKMLFEDSSCLEWKNITQAYNNIGLAYNCIGDYKRAIEYFEKSKNDSYALYSKGYAYEKIGDFETAIEAYLASMDTSMEDKFPNTLIDAYYYTGLACYNRGLKPELTDIKCLEKFSRFVTGSELKSINGKVEINKLKHFYFRKALECFEKALEKDPYNINLWVHEARTLYELNSNKEAIDCLKEAIKINSNNGLLYTVISNIYLDVGNLDDASRNLNKALRIGYESSVIWKLKGLIHIERKEYDDSIICLEKAILLNAENDDSIDPLLFLWKAYAKYLKIEFSSTPKDTVKYMECIHSIIRDLERTFLNENECIGECSLYFIGCFYYKINDI